MMRKLIDWIAGRIGLQRFFEFLYGASLYGMNFGNTNGFKKDGESCTLVYVRAKFPELEESLNLFDVGANQGTYSIELANIFLGRKYMIHSFEPSKPTFDVLIKNLGNRKGIIANNLGCGERKENLKLFTRGPVSGMSSVYKRKLDHIGIEMSQVEDVTFTTIDEYCLEKKMEHIHFLKMDIEGHEYKCLSGAATMLKNKSIDFIQFEFGGCNIDSRTYFQDYWYLLNQDYNIYRIVKNGLVHIKKYNERLEVFKNINYLAELKKSS
ncbi:MAG: FkbM family methyltransferase [Ferruginibacter sp.]